MIVHASWKPDCGGKKDYDCPLVSLSCRLYPRGGGFFTLGPSGWAGNSERPDIRPSANASICIGDLVNGPYSDLCETEFEGDTEEEVKGMVEKWAQMKYEEIIAVLSGHFGVNVP